MNMFQFSIFHPSICTPTVLVEKDKRAKSKERRAKRQETRDKRQKTRNKRQETRDKRQETRQDALTSAVAGFAFLSFNGGEATFFS
jgi:uncharacterized membrane protein